MIRIYDKFVRKYISKKYIGENPGLIHTLLKTDSYRDYEKRVEEVSADIKDHSYDAHDLILYLVKQYELPLNKARDFVHKNVVHRWRKADNIEKRCMRIHANRGLEEAFNRLESFLEEVRNSK